MGKQSGRLYYNGDDHLDIALKDEGKIYNHSKIYKGSKLLWKREKPKYLFLFVNRKSFIYDGRLSSYGCAICTSDSLKSLSAFDDCPVNMNPVNSNLKRGAFVDIDYAFDKYFALVVIGTRANEESDLKKTYYICYSKDGYDWKKIPEIQFGEIVPYGLKKYVYGNKEVLTVISQNDILFIDADYNMRTVFSFSDSYGQYNARYGYSIRSKDGTLLIAPKQFGVRIVARRESFSTAREDQYIKRYSNISKDGYFYMLKQNKSIFVNYDLLRSGNATDWTNIKTNIRVFPGGKVDGEVIVCNITVIDGYLYILSIYKQNSTSNYGYPYIIKMDLENKSTEEKLIEKYNTHWGIESYFVIGNIIFLKMLSANEDIYYIKCKDIFAEEQEEETARITCQIKTSPNFNNLIKISSSDCNSGVTI